MANRLGQMRRAVGAVFAYEPAERGVDLPAQVGGCIRRSPRLSAAAVMADFKMARRRIVYVGRLVASSFSRRFGHPAGSDLARPRALAAGRFPERFARFAQTAASAACRLP